MWDDSGSDWGAPAPTPKANSDRRQSDKTGDDSWGAPAPTSRNNYRRPQNDDSDKGSNNNSWGAPRGGNRKPQGSRDNSYAGSSDNSWGAPTTGSRDNFKRPQSFRDNNDSTANDDPWGSSDSSSRGSSKRPQNFKDNNDSAADGDSWGASDSGSRSSSKRPQNFKNNNENMSNDDTWGTSDSGSRGNFKRSQSFQDNDGAEGPKKRFKDENGEEIERPEPYKPGELNLEEETELQGNVGENFQRLSEQKVTCLPLDIIKPIEKFTDVIESKLLLTNIETQKYTAMTPIQKWAMPAILGGHDLIACAQTGSGKTAAFLLPILQTLLKTELEPNDLNNDCQNPYCLIISPTRELANQIYVHGTLLSRDSIIKVQVIYGGVSTPHLKSRISTGCHILVATPGRLKDFVQRGWIGFKNIKYIILDEGDRLVDDGFTSDIRTFFNHESMPPIEKRQTLFFSATFKESTQLSAKDYLKESFIFLTVGRVGAANENISQEFIQVSRENKKRELKRILGEVPENEKTIIFTQTKNAADMLAGFFNALKLSSTSIHGDRHQSQREEAIRAFKKGEKRFLISSPVGNRGLDLPKVAIVINYDLPKEIDEYVHRIGRTGRAGHTGRAISFYEESRDRELLPSLIEILTEAKQPIPDWMQGGGESSSAQDQDGDWNAGDWDKPAATASNTQSEKSDKPIGQADDDWGNSVKSEEKKDDAKPVSDGWDDSGW